MTREKKTIIITGASSGLGAALAAKYSQNGHRLFLFARSKERLDAVAKICTANRAEAHVLSIDVTNSAEMEKQLNEIAYQYGIDIVIACAGVSAGTLDGPETAMQVRKIFATVTRFMLRFFSVRTNASIVKTAKLLDPSRTSMSISAAMNTILPIFDNLDLINRKYSPVTVGPTANFQGSACMYIVGLKRY